MRVVHVHVVCGASSDAVVRVAIDDAKGVRTSLVSNSFNPKWNTAFAFPVSEKCVACGWWQVVALCGRH